MTADDLNFHRKLLACIAERMAPELYLEIGMGSCPVIMQIAQFCKQCVGVDIKKCHAELPVNVIQHTMHSDDFFRDYAGPHFNLIFIDADHAGPQVLKDALSAAAILAPNGLILMHDTFPANKEECGYDRCGTAHRVPPLLVGPWVTLPLPPGITIYAPRNAWLFEGVYS